MFASSAPSTAQQMCRSAPPGAEAVQAVHTPSCQLAGLAKMNVSWDTSLKVLAAAVPVPTSCACSQAAFPGNWFLHKVCVPALQPSSRVRSSTVLTCHRCRQLCCTSPLLVILQGWHDVEPVQQPGTNGNCLAPDIADHTGPESRPYRLRLHSRGYSTATGGQ